MTKIVKIIGIILFILPTLGFMPNNSDRTIVMGQRAGLIKGGMSYSEISGLYGYRNLSNYDFEEEGEVVKSCTSIYKNTPSEIVVCFDRGKATTVTLLNTSTSWKLSNGLKIGSKGQDFERLNGKPFLYSGFEWDYGGRVTSWQNGRFNQRLWVTFDIKDRRGRYPTGTADYPVGDNNFYSNRLRNHTLYANEITVRLY